MKKLLFLLVTIICCACKNEAVPEDIIVEGNVQGVPDGKVYLADAYRTADVRDSADCVGGKFKFVIKPDKSFVPYFASIYFKSPSNLRGTILSFRNHMKEADSMKHLTSAFFLERGLTSISGDNKNPPYLRVFAGRETDLAFAKDYRFGAMGNSIGVQRQEKLDRNASEIRKHPYSYFLLQNLFLYKTGYSEAELKELFALFDSEVRESKLGEDFRTYFNNRVDSGKPYPTLSMLTENGQKQPVINPAAKLNMLVFWSSWCGPCRREIPVFKQIEKEYRGKGLNLVSISIDEYKERWTQALAEEKMVWPQLIVSPDKISYMQETFNFVAIPLVVFTNDEGIEVARFTGNEEGHKERYQEVINRYLEPSS